MFSYRIKKTLEFSLRELKSFYFLQFIFTLSCKTKAFQNFSIENDCSNHQSNLKQNIKTDALHKNWNWINWVYSNNNYFYQIIFLFQKLKTLPLSKYTLEFLNISSSLSFHKVTFFWKKIYFTHTIFFFSFLYIFLIFTLIFSVIII